MCKMPWLLEFSRLPIFSHYFFYFFFFFLSFCSEKTSSFARFITLKKSCEFQTTEIRLPCSPINMVYLLWRCLVKIPQITNGIEQFLRGRSRCNYLLSWQLVLINLIMLHLFSLSTSIKGPKCLCILQPILQTWWEVPLWIMSLISQRNYCQNMAFLLFLRPTVISLSLPPCWNLCD